MQYSLESMERESIANDQKRPKLKQHGGFLFVREHFKSRHMLYLGLKEKITLRRNVSVSVTFGPYEAGSVWSGMKGTDTGRVLVSVLVLCRTLVQSELHSPSFSLHQYNLTPGLQTQTSPQAKFSKPSNINL